MFGIDDIGRSVKIFKWIRNLGAEHTSNIKVELEDLMFHASMSLNTILEIIDLIEEFNIDKFDYSEFKELNKVCRRFYLDPKVLEKCRTHCTDLFRDVERIEFKLAKIGRTEGMRVGDLNNYISDVGYSEGQYLESFNGNIEFLEKSLKQVLAYINDNKKNKAKELFKELKTKMLSDLDELAKAKKEMIKAKNKIKSILT